MSNVHITDFRKGFPFGYTRMLGLEDIANNVGMEFGILRLAGGDLYSSRGTDLKGTGLETQIIILGGEGRVRVGDTVFEVQRKSLFDENPWAFDLPPRCAFEVSSKRELELAMVRAENKKTFAPIILSPEEIPAEQRGEGVAGGTMHRIVKAIFGDPMAPKKARPKASNLVIGEVVNFPGRWSSYPPHYHPQNEVYYYRFDKPQGYGFSHVDEPAPVVRNHDVIKILNCAGHDQTSAPGYAMWYLWFIRQRPDMRYEGDPPFEYFSDHKWILEKDAEAKIWKPK